MTFRVIVTGRCDSTDYALVTSKIRSIVPENDQIALVLGGTLTTLNEICIAYAGYLGWNIERDLSVMHQSPATRMLRMCREGADYWIVFGRNVGQNGGGATKLAKDRDIPLDICDLKWH